MQPSLYFPSFDARGDPSSTGQRWTEYIERFENFLTAMEIDDPKRQRALLLHFSGDDVYRIFKTLPETGEAKDYKKAVEKLTGYFKPKKNIEFERYTFRQANQHEAETLDAYHTRLQQLATHCEFHEKDAEVKSQIISGCSSKRVRRKALREPALKLQELLDFGRSLEISEGQASGIEHATTAMSDLQVNKVKFHPKPQRGSTKTRSLARVKTCFNCGGSYPHSQEKPCPAKGKLCRACKKPNHFEKVCRSKVQEGNNPAKTKQGKSNRAVQAVQRGIDTDESTSQSSETSDDEIVFGVQNAQKCASKPPKATVTVGNCKIDVIVDTGASINILDTPTFNKIVGQNPKLQLTSSTSKVFAYAADVPLDIAGKFETEIETRHRITFGTFYVARKSTGNLLSFQTATELNLLHVNIDNVQAETPAQHPSSTIHPTETCSVPSGNMSSRLIKEHSQLFVGVGKLKDTQIKLHIDENVTPIAQPARRVPFHMRKALDKALDELEDNDIIEPAIGATPWVSPLVVFPKPNNPDEIRVCVDMRRANQAITRERHPTPTVDEIIHDLNGATVFSKLDLNKGYHQLELDIDSRGITTFATHRGLYRYQRLAFGISSAAEVFQYQIQTALAGIPGCRNLSDDIIVFGKTQQEHDQALRNVFQRLSEKGLTLNKRKCTFNKANLNFYGYAFSAEGMKADEKKVQAIKETATPKTVSELRSFLGLVNYVSRFIKDFATIAAPLRDLTKKSTKWTWTDQHQAAFDSLKEALTSKSVVAYFDPKKSTEIIVDASPVGLGAILTQKTVRSDGTVHAKVCAYASRALSDVERRYSQTEKEALAIVWACEKFHLYIYGAQFNIVTDHKALEIIFNNPNSRPPARIERWSLRLQNYDFTVTFKPGKENPADFMSRHPVSTSKKKHINTAEEYVNFITRHATPVAITSQEILSEMAKDSVMTELKSIIMNETWHKSSGVPELKAFKLVKDELTVADDGFILKGTKLVIPSKLRNRVINLAHEGHQGIVKTKSLLREKVWFPGIDQMVENTVKNCIPCQATTAKEKLEPYKMSKLPRGPWDKVSVDFSGPYPNGEYLLVVIDEYSRFPEIEIVRSTAGKSVIPKLNRIFSSFGIPRVVKSDNGPPFNGYRFKDFKNELGFHHRKITPHWPRANGEVERFMRTLNKTVEAAHCENKVWQHELFTFLRNYRATPHTTTGETPASLMFARNIATKLPEFAAKKQNDEAVRQKDQAAKERMKGDAEKRKQHESHTFNIGDTVLVKSERKNKLSTFYDPNPYEITAIKGSMITAERADHQITRNCSWFKNIPKQSKSLEIDEDDISPMPSETMPSETNEQFKRRYPLRQRKQTDFYFGQ